MPVRKTEIKKTKKEKTARTPRKTRKVTEKKEKVEKVEKKKVKYFEETGRRKTAVARVRIYPQGEKKILVNDKDFKEYFPTLDLQQTVLSPFIKTDLVDQYGATIKVKGGGMTAQAEAARHGIAKALVLSNLELRHDLKKAGYLTRDPRMRERKKFGLKRARRAPQWAKR
jgi:small subunit ribosomal protein S9